MQESMSNIREFLQGDQFVKLCGITLEEVAPGCAVAKMKIEDHHMNAAGTVQGGALFTLADFAFAAASNTRARTLGINANISFFLSPKGNYVIATAREVSQSNRLSSYTVEIRDETGALVALFNAMAYKKRISENEKQLEISIDVAKGREDFEIIERLAREIWPEHYGQIVDMGQVEYMLGKFQTARAMEQDVSAEGYMYYIAREAGSAVGYCAVKPEEEQIFLSKIYLLKAHRGKGIARMFLNRLIDDHGEGRQTIWLTVNKYNQSSIERYQQMGFQTVEDLKTDIGGGYIMDDYKMELKIR